MIEFKVGDKVSIKSRKYYGYGKKWIVEYVFKTGEVRLRNAQDEDQLIERYGPNELIKGWSKKRKNER